MVLTKFLSELRESGGVVLVGADMPTEDDVRQCSEAIGELDAMARLELAGAAPPLDIKAAKWATIMFYRCCQFLAFRDIPPSTIAQTLNNPCPCVTTPSVVYSADLLLRYLPDCARLAQGLSPDDPLVEGLREMGRNWPLSSVGMKDIGPVEIDSFIGDESLAQLYADRITACADTTRTDDPRVQAIIKQNLGIHNALRPALADSIGKEAST